MTCRCIRGITPDQPTHIKRLLDRACISKGRIRQKPCACNKTTTDKICLLESRCDSRHYTSRFTVTRRTTRTCSTTSVLFESFTFRLALEVLLKDLLPARLLLCLLLLNMRLFLAASATTKQLWDLRLDEIQIHCTVQYSLYDDTLAVVLPVST